MKYIVKVINNKIVAEYVDLEEALQHNLDNPGVGYICDENGNYLYSRTRCWVEWHEYPEKSAYRYGWKPDHQGGGNPMKSSASRRRKVIWDKEVLA